MTSRLKDPLTPTIDVLDALHCGAVLVGPDGRILHANARLCQMMERPSHELAGRRFWAFYAPEDARRLQGEFHQDVNAEVEKEIYLPRAGGEPLPVIISSRPLESTEPLSGHRVLTIIDVSRQKRAERRYREQYQEVARLSDTVLEQALDLKHYSRALEERIEERTAELKEANLDSILMLAVASEARDPDTGAHVLRIKEYAQALARELCLSEAESEEIGFSAILHDVGMIQVPDEILKKPGPLTAEERKAMEVHAIAGERILSKRPFFDIARVIARSHHENWDGSGYPEGLSGTNIRLPARIVHLADVFDALTTPRVYKPAWPLPNASAEIRRCSGTMFDPHLAEVFRSLLDAGAFEETMARREPTGSYEDA
ncbi:MAG: HD domain-containing phosphohydrolase [Phycisphaerae bacterium]